MTHANTLVLKVDQFGIDLVNVDVDPRDIVVAAYSLQHAVVQLVQLLQQIQLLANALQLRVVSDLHTEQLLAAGKRLVTAPQVVEVQLEDIEPVTSFTRWKSRYHWPSATLSNVCHRSSFTH